MTRNDKFIEDCAIVFRVLIEVIIHELSQSVLIKSVDLLGFLFLGERPKTIDRCR